MARIITIISVILLSFIDQIIKIAVKNKLAPLKEFVVIKDIFRLRYVENSGAVFGSFQSNTKILAVITSVVIIITIYLLLSKKIKNRILYVCLVFIVSGGIGNLIDRISRGFVIDYLEPLFIDFAIFNFADCLVTVGAFAMMGYLIFDLFRETRKAKK